MQSPAHEGDVSEPDLVVGRDGEMRAGERDAAAQLIPRLVVAHAGEPDRVDPAFRLTLKDLLIRFLSMPYDLKA